jgi:hypothetical protein
LGAVPAAVGHYFLGATWDAARPLLWLVAVQIVAVAATIGPQVGLKAMAAAGLSLACHSVNAAMLLIAGYLGSRVGSAEGVAAAIAIASVLAAILWWRCLTADTAPPTTAPEAVDGLQARRGIE